MNEEKAPVREWNDVYDGNRNLTGRVHLRGTPWEHGTYGLVVCVWVYDGKGNFLLTRRAPQKSYAGTWENSGGAAKAGETSRQAIARELAEETGISASPDEFEYLCSGQDSTAFYDFYCLRKEISLCYTSLQPNETDGIMWASYRQIHDMILREDICSVIAEQFLRQEPMLKRRNPCSVE